MEPGPRRYEMPFCPSSQKGEPCVCIACGQHAIAEKQISHYPMRYVPIGWSTSSSDKGLRCGTCTAQQKVHPEFALNNEVWMTAKSPDRYSSHPGEGETYHIVKVVRNPVPITVTHAAKVAPIYTDATAVATQKEINMEHPEETDDRDDEEVAAMRRPRHVNKILNRRSRFRQQAAAVGDALALGGKLALANEAGDIMIDIAKEMAKDMPMVAMALEHPDGREIAKMLVALSIHSATVHTSLVPQSEFVGEAAKLQLSASSMALLQPRLKALRKHFLKLAEVGEQMAAVQARVESEEEVAEREAAEAEVEAELADMKAETKANGRAKKTTSQKRA